MDHLAHDGPTILRDCIKYLRLGDETTCAQPFRVFRVQVSEQIFGFELG
jgi:hypothetical protein